MHHYTDDIQKLFFFALTQGKLGVYSSGECKWSMLHSSRKQISTTCRKLSIFSIQKESLEMSKTTSTLGEMLPWMSWNVLWEGAFPYGLQELPSGLELNKICGQEDVFLNTPLSTGSVAPLSAITLLVKIVTQVKKKNNFFEPTTLYTHIA